MGNHGQHEVLDGDKSKEYVEDWKIGGIRNARGVCVEERETVVGSTGHTHNDMYVPYLPHCPVTASRPGQNLRATPFWQASRPA